MANWKQKVKKSTASQGGGPYIREGTHLLRLDMIKEVESFANDDIAVAEFVVEETDSEHPDMKPGKTVSRLWNFTQHQSAAGNYKAFLIAAYGNLDDDGEFEALEEDELSDEMIDVASSEKNPFNGALFYCVGNTIITKKNKKEFTKCRWELREYPEEIPF